MDKLRELDRLLQQRRGYSFKELKNKLNLGDKSDDPIRKIFGYENGLEEGIRHGKDWPEYLRVKYKKHLKNETIIEKFKVSGDNHLRFRYAEKDFSLFGNELTQYVIDSIIPVLEKLNQIHGISNIYINELEELADVINNQRKGEYKKKIEKIESGRKIIRSDALKVFSLDKDDEISEKDDYTGSIYNAITQNNVIEITYKPPNTTPSKIICHPYSIAESSDRWYLIAYIEEALNKDSVFIKKERIGKINTLEIRRIISPPITLENNNYKESIPLDEINNILNDTFGLSLSGDDNSWENPKREELKLELDESLVFYFRTKPFIGGKEDIDQNIYTRPKTIITNELKKKILSFGKQIKVIKPIALREQIKREIEESIKKYEK